MVFDILDTALRLAITLEFGFIGIAGVLATVHCITMDSRIRTMAAQQQEMIKGIKEALEAQLKEREEKRQARLAAMAANAA